MGRRFTPTAEQRAFLDALAAGYSVSGAALKAGVDRASPYRWRQRSSVFAAEWEAAWTAGADALEDEALRRAVKGTKKPVYRGGEVVGHTTEFSDAMLMQLLKARKPDKFGAAAKEAAAPDIDFEGAKHALFSKFRAVADESETPGVPDVPDR